MLRVMEMHRDATDEIDPACPRTSGSGPRSLGRVPGERPPPRLSQRPGHGAGPHRHDRLHDGLRYDGHRARYRAGEVQAACRRRHDEDRQPHGARVAQTLGLQARPPIEIVKYIDEHDTIEGAPELRDEHLPVFDCAFKPKNGKRSIHWQAHVEDDGGRPAVPLRCDLQDGQHAPGIDGRGHRERLPRRLAARPQSAGHLSRRLEAEPAAGHAKRAIARRKARLQPTRRRLPATRQSLTHKFSVGGHEGYITVGLFEDGQPGELFITMAKEGSTIGGLMDTIGTETSLGLQYGVPLRVFVDKFSHTRFEPSGWTNNQEIPHAKSVVDYIFRWLGIQFIPGYREANTPHRPPRPARTAEAKNAATAAGTTANGATATGAAGNGAGPLRPIRRSLERERKRQRQGEASRRRARTRARRSRNPQPAVRQFPDRCPGLRQLRRNHGPQRQLLLVSQLWEQHGM